MRFWLTIILLVAFTGIAVFGFAGMAGNGHQHSGCLAATARGADCPDESNALASVVFHLGALKSFSTGLAGLTATLLIVLGASLLFVANRNLPLFFVFRSFIPLTHSPPLVQAALKHWLTLHETSPTNVTGFRLSAER